LNAIAENQRRRSLARGRGRSLAQGCDVAQVSALKWPTEEIEARLRPTEAQRAKLVALQDTSSRAADMLKTSCQPDDAVTPAARLAAVCRHLAKVPRSDVHRTVIVISTRIPLKTH